MATDAGARRLLVVIAGLIPALHGVTSFAGFGGRRMCERLAGCLRSVVTSSTGARCALEAATRVAGIAGRAGVAADERKSSNSMIEAGCLLRARGCTRGCAKYHAQQRGEIRDF